MPTVHYRTPTATYDVEVDEGSNLMQAAVDDGVPGIDGDCGGQAACATCHVYIEETWLAKLGDVTAVEDSMLNTVVDRKENSRLACQIAMSEELDGLVLNVPAAQH